jgi:hypothetical protein
MLKDFFTSVEELDKFIIQHKNKKRFRMVVKPFGLAIFYDGKLQKTIKKQK